MDRGKILSLIDVASTRGLEIGALDKPLVTRDMGPVEHVDYATREALARIHAANPDVRTEALAEVDHIWGDKTLLEIVGGQRAYGYVLASHVIEHVPDLLGWLQEIAAVLADGGVAVFVVPDKRYTFDMHRRTSVAAELVDAYVRRLRRPDPRQLFDCFYNFHHPATGANRHGAPKTEASMTREAREVLAACRDVLANGVYIDAHCWVFTPRSMAEALDLASRLDLLPFEVARLEPEPSSGEFLLVLRRLADDLGPEARRAAFEASLAGLQLPQEPEPGLLSADVSALEAQMAQARARIHALEASTSWRITAPLRAAVQLARRLRPASS
jgi:SAM-dependent methyltransferase